MENLLLRECAQALRGQQRRSSGHRSPQRIAGSIRQRDDQRLLVRCRLQQARNERRQRHVPIGGDDAGVQYAQLDLRLRRALPDTDEHRERTSRIRWQGRHRDGRDIAVPRLRSRLDRCEHQRHARRDSARRWGRLGQQRPLDSEPAFRAPECDDLQQVAIVARCSHDRALEIATRADAIEGKQGCRVKQRHHALPDNTPCVGLCCCNAHGVKGQRRVALELHDAVHDLQQRRSGATIRDHRNVQSGRIRPHRGRVTRQPRKDSVRYARTPGDRQARVRPRKVHEPEGAAETKFRPSEVPKRERSRKGDPCRRLCMCHSSERIGKPCAISQRNANGAPCIGSFSKSHSRNGERHQDGAQKRSLERQRMHRERKGLHGGPWE